MQNHKLKFHSCCFFKFSNFCKISRAPAISLHSDNKFPSCSASKQLGNLLRMRQISIEKLKLKDFPEEITKCSWLLYIFECLFNLYNFFAGEKDKDKVKCTLRFQCIEYLVCVWTPIEYYNLDTNKKTFDTLNLQSCPPIVASLTALSNEKQVRIWAQTERSSMLIQLTYILFKYGWF